MARVSEQVGMELVVGSWPIRTCECAERERRRAGEGAPLHDGVADGDWEDGAADGGQVDGHRHHQHLRREGPGWAGGWDGVGGRRGKRGERRGGSWGGGPWGGVGKGHQQHLRREGSAEKERE
jgi:hypothetical protein